MRRQPVENIGRNGISAYQFRYQNDNCNRQRIQRDNAHAVQGCHQASACTVPAPFQEKRHGHRNHRKHAGRQQRGESPQDRFDNRAPQRSAADRGVRLQQRLRHRRRIRVRNRIYGRIRCRVGRCHIPGLRNRGRITRSGNRCRRRRRRPSCGRLYGGYLQRNRKSTVGGRQATLVVASHPFHHGFQRRFAARGDPHFLNEFGAFLEITDLHREQRIVHSYGFRKLFDPSEQRNVRIRFERKSRRIRAAVVRARIVHVPRFRDPGLKNNPGNPVAGFGDGNRPTDRIGRLSGSMQRRQQQGRQANDFFQK